MIRTFLCASLALALFACSDDGSSSSGSSSGGSSSGESSSGESSSGESSSGSSSTSTQKYSCSINGSCYKCPTASAVQNCFKEGAEAAGCSSADEEFCKSE